MSVTLVVLTNRCDTKSVEAARRQLAQESAPWPTGDGEHVANFARLGMKLYFTLQRSKRMHHKQGVSKNLLQKQINPPFHPVEENKKFKLAEP